ncbi:hypothetical protein ACFX13_038917 [Malus domestica]|uniref:Uncharacterized protein n=1 Tax=Malus domestica TaxID=3750 RepID=A0A498JKP8_MALDO|nr:hypothetical protein DVH24_008095 [Malus domestica]
MVIRKKFQLVGMIAMLLSCKYEEVYREMLDKGVNSDEFTYVLLMVKTLKRDIPSYQFITKTLSNAEKYKKEGISFLIGDLKVVVTDNIDMGTERTIAEQIPDPVMKRLDTKHCVRYKLGKAATMHQTVVLDTTMSTPVFVQGSLNSVCNRYQLLMWEVVYTADEDLESITDTQTEL